MPYNRLSCEKYNCCLEFILFPLSSKGVIRNTYIFQLLNENPLYFRQFFFSITLLGMKEENPGTAKLEQGLLSRDTKT